MQDPGNSGGILAWLLGGLAVGGALYRVGQRVFSTVTRKELEKIVEAQDEKFLDALQQQRTDLTAALDNFRQERRQASEEQRTETLRLHMENRDTSSQIFTRVSDVEKGLSRIEGSLSGRFQRPDQR